MTYFGVIDIEAEASKSSEVVLEGDINGNLPLDTSTLNVSEDNVENYIQNCREDFITPSGQNGSVGISLAWTIAYKKTGNTTFSPATISLAGSIPSIGLTTSLFSTSIPPGPVVDPTYDPFPVTVGFCYNWWRLICKMNKKC